MKNQLKFQYLQIQFDLLIKFKLKKLKKKFLFKINSKDLEYIKSKLLFSRIN